MTNLLLITGPTAVGKTETAVEVAMSLDGEVISADSRQIYKYLDVGTSKPSQNLLKKVKHHLIDLKEPSEQYSAGEFARDAEKIARYVIQRGKVPIVCGGATLYIRALTSGLFKEPHNRRDRMKLRRELKERARREGTEDLYEDLCEADPHSAARIERNDTQRIIRALEVYLSTGIPISTWHDEVPERPELNILSFCLFLERDELTKRIEQRTREMIRNGLVEEVKKLLDEGLDEEYGPLKSVGYREIVDYLKGTYPLEEAERLITRNTRRYAKRQMTWFKKMNGLRWIRSGPDAGREICDEWYRWTRKAG